ncbi:MAG TPA: MYXO-CTERM sorting domain-containing protein [Polyangiaceae bacterium]|nr:MYXO-CTERM sorting domain-containing protein [Polyangiaceae bacterium]
MRMFQSWAWVLVSLVLGSVSLPAQAQSCPSGYGSCDNGGCCLNSAQCCPNLSDGCCDTSTPFCCGDGTCASSPSECGSVSGVSCPGFDVPCGPGCIAAGSDCCDDEGHYCKPQSICMSATECVTGLDVSASLPPEVKPTVVTPSAPVRRISPLLDPPDGTARSCALSPSAPASTSPGGWQLLAAGVALAVARRRRS